jgi:lipoate-protein ligase B
LHLPGQLAGYLMLPLDRFGISVESHVKRLNRILIDVLAEFDLHAANLPDGSGVFLGTARVATVGVAVSRWIAYHGFTLNVGPFLEPFRLILDEPGPGGRSLRQTSMESWRQRITPATRVRSSIIERVGTEFGLEQQNLFTDHPSIRQKVRPDVHVSSSG